MSELDYFDVPEDGLEARLAGYAQSDNPYGFSTPAGITWARQWGQTESRVRQIEGTFGATAEDYERAGLKMPDRSLEEVWVGPIGGPFQPLGVASIQTSPLGSNRVALGLDLSKRFVVSTTFRVDPGVVAFYFGVPPTVLGLHGWHVAPPEPEPEPVDPTYPADWSTLELEELVKPVLEVVHPEPTLDRYVSGRTGPLVDVELDRSMLTPGGWAGIRSTEQKRLDDLRATMHEDRPTLRPPRELGPPKRRPTGLERRRHP